MNAPAQQPGGTPAKSKKPEESSAQRGFLARIQSTGETPTRGIDGKLIIGTMTLDEGEDLVTKPLLCKKRGNGMNWYWGRNSKRSCTLANRIGQDETKLVLDLGQWAPNPKTDLNKTSLANAIRDRAKALWMAEFPDNGEEDRTTTTSKTTEQGQKSGNTTQRGDSEAPGNNQSFLSFEHGHEVDEKAVINTVYQALNIPAYHGELKDLVSPLERLMLAHWRRDCIREGVFLEETEDYKTYAAEVRAKSLGGGQNEEPPPVAMNDGGDSEEIKDASGPASLNESDTSDDTSSIIFPSSMTDVDYPEEEV